VGWSRLNVAVRDQLLTTAAIVVKGGWLDAGTTRFGTLLDDLRALYANDADAARVRGPPCRHRYLCHAQHG
jgi:hypothetical protein